jgi:hypothetical protein
MSDHQNFNSVIRASPAFNTAGGGFAFETEVGAYTVAAMLAGRPVVGEQVGVPARVSFQNAALGFALDDLTVAGVTARWSGSIKSYDMLGRAGGRLPVDFAEDAWSDLLREGLDEPAALVGLVCGRANDELWRALDDLVVAARLDAPDRLAARIEAGGAFNDRHRSLWASAQCPEILAETVGLNAGSSSAILFARLVPLRLDLQHLTSTGAQQAVAWCTEALVAGQSASAEDLWCAIRVLVADVRIRGGSIDWALVQRQLGERFAFARRPDASPDWQILDRLTQTRLEGVRDSLADGLHLPRAEARSRLDDLGAEPGLAFLTGPSGCGKTALAKAWIQEGDGDALWLTAADLDRDLLAFERDLGLRMALVTVLGLGRPPMRIVIDGLDRAASDAAFVAAAALARLAAASTATQLLVTTQLLAADGVTRRLRDHGGPPATATIAIGDLDDDDVRLAVTDRSALSRLAVQGELRDVLRRPKVLEVALAALDRVPDAQLVALGDEAAVARLWWDALALGEQGARALRGELLRGLATRQADQLVDAVPAGDPGDLAVFIGQADALRADGILAPSDDSYAFDHDLFADWSRFQVLRTFAGDDARLIAKTPLPAWHRALRLLALDVLHEEDVDGWLRRSQALRAMPGGDLAADLFLEAPVFAQDAADRLAAVWPVLAAADQPLIGRLLHRFLFVASIPDPRTSQIADSDPELAAYAAALWRIPLWPLWPPVLRILAEHADEAVNAAPAQVAEIADIWLSRTPVGTPLRAEAAALGLALGRWLASDTAPYFDRDIGKKLWRAVLAAGGERPADVLALCAAGFAADDSEDVW